MKQNEMKCVNGKNCNANAENSVTLDNILIWFLLKLVLLASVLFTQRGNKHWVLIRQDTVRNAQKLTMFYVASAEVYS